MGESTVPMFTAEDEDDDEEEEEEEEEEDDEDDEEEEEEEEEEEDEGGGPASPFRIERSTRLEYSAEKRLWACPAPFCLSTA
jgi:hypothetical protein